MAIFRKSRKFLPREKVYSREKRLIGEINLFVLLTRPLGIRGKENRGYCAKEVSRVSLVIALVYRFAHLNF